MKRRHFTALIAVAAMSGALSWAATPKDTAPVLVVGDSISAEYGLKRGSGWVQHLQTRLDKEKIPARMINAGISADTSSGGRSRLPTLLKQHQPAIVIIELGANDALRGLSLSMTQDNLATMVRLSREAGARVVIVGMQVPPNYGGPYTRDFQRVFQTVAATGKASLVPFLLKGVADQADPTRLFQEDRIHPNEAAQPIMAENVWKVLAPLLPKR